MSRSIVSSVGTRDPPSIRLTASTEMPARSQSCSCVKPRSVAQLPDARTYAFVETG